MKLQGISLGEEIAEDSRLIFCNPNQISFPQLKPSDGIHCAWDRIPDLWPPWDLAPISFPDLPPLAHSAHSSLASSLFLSSTRSFILWAFPCAVPSA